MSPTVSVASGLRPREEVSFQMPEVIIHDDESFERALKRFKKKCEKAGILSDLRKHRHYEKPSERRKRKMNAACRKTRQDHATGCCLASAVEMRREPGGKPEMEGVQVTTVAGTPS